MSIDPTRLLVLGAVRQEQPASGYAIMRELTSWGVQDWASVNPGSIYGSLRALEKEGLVTLDADGVPTGRSHKTSAKYVLTRAGATTFTAHLHAGLRDVEPYRSAPFMAALCFLVDLPRSEVIAALQGRTVALDLQLHTFTADEAQKPRDPKNPEHSVEFVRLAAARIEGELSYTRSVLRRIEAGDYTFTQETTNVDGTEEALASTPP